MDTKSRFDEGRLMSVSIRDIVRNINNVNLDEEILVFEYKFPMVSPEYFPMRCDALILILCTSGTGTIGVDLKEYEIRRNTLVVLQPKNYVTLSLFDEDCRAKVLVCSRKIAEEVFPRHSEILPLLMHHRTDPVLYLSEYDAKSVRGYYEFLHSKLSAPKSYFLKEKVMCLMQAVLYELLDIREQMTEMSQIQRNRKEEIMAKFLLAVSEHFREERQVGYYADMLCITPKHLSTVVREVSGRTAGNWIENYVVMEAKVLLRTTDLSIQEIASRLNFLNQSFFGKYFKHLTGMSPTQFRKKEG